MEDYTDTLRNLGILGSSNIPDIVNGISSLTSDYNEWREAMWESVAAEYKPFFDEVTPLTIGYYNEQRQLAGIDGSFTPDTTDLATPLAIGLTASAFAYTLKKAKRERQEELERLQVEIMKAHLMGFQQQGAETLAKLSRQDTRGGRRGVGMRLIPRALSCKFCKKVAAEFEEGGYQPARCHKNCSCGKMPVWQAE